MTAKKVTAIAAMMDTSANINDANIRGTLASIVQPQINGSHDCLNLGRSFCPSTDPLRIPIIPATMETAPNMLGMLPPHAINVFKYYFNFTCF